MAGMGPPPKSPENRVRRNATVGMTTLPAEGRTKPAPKWPLIPDVVLTAKCKTFEGKLEQLQEGRQEKLAAGEKTGPIDRRIDATMEQLSIAEAQLAAQRELESTLWADLWRLPQAVEWERMAWLRDVAQYVRFKVLGELGDLDGAKEARMWSDRLGLTPLAMLRLRWRVAEDELAQKRQEKKASSGTDELAKRRKLLSGPTA